MREQINNLIISLIVIKEFSKDIHYTAHGEAFYAKHLLVDKFEWDDYIDLLKECSLLGNDIRPLSAKDYLKKVSDYLLNPREKDDKGNFNILIGMLNSTLNLIDEMQDLSKADENLVGAIAQDLKQYKGLLNLQVE